MEYSTVSNIMHPPVGLRLDEPITWLSSQIDAKVLLQDISQKKKGVPPPFNQFSQWPLAVAGNLIPKGAATKFCSGGGGRRIHVHPKHPTSKNSFSPRISAIFILKMLNHAKKNYTCQEKKLLIYNFWGGGDAPR